MGRISNLKTMPRRMETVDGEICPQWGRYLATDYSGGRIMAPSTPKELIAYLSLPRVDILLELRTFRVKRELETEVLTRII